MKKTIMVFLVLALLAGSAFATMGRIEGMGKSDRYLLDEMAMFTNPAYFLVYPNVLTGTLGRYTEGYGIENLSEQWFGGWLSMGNVSFGAAFNRTDPLQEFLVARKSLNYRDEGTWYKLFLPTSWDIDTVDKATFDINKSDYDHGNNTFFVFDTLSELNVQTEIPEPVGEAEAFLGYNLGNMGIGLHLFNVMQQNKTNKEDSLASGVLRGDLGLVMKLSEKDLLDIVLTGARITYFSKIASGSKGLDDLNEATIAIGASARAYLTVASIGGQLVPSVKFSRIPIAKDTTLYVSPGIGYQREIEGGMFWSGFDYGYMKELDAEGGDVDTTITSAYTVSFGIEKQVAWPWFILRVGGKKVIAPTKVHPHEGDPFQYTGTNSDNARTVDDVIGAGVSFKVGENLRFDVAANERVPFANLFNNSLETLATRIDATYEF